jgi:hypothetical protein
MRKGELTMMTRRAEQIPSMRRIDIEEDPRNNDDFLFQKFFEENQSTVQWWREI